MPKQVLAEDIERFLATLEGVASARLLTGQEGEIEQVYITAEEGAEARSARRSAVAALLSRYGIPIEPWRVQVVQLKRFAPSELPRLVCLRLEESVSPDGTTARVHVAWDRAGDRRTAMGQARGPTGTGHRARTFAAAALDASRGVVDPPHRRIVLQQVAETTCMDRPLWLVAITATGPARQESFVGTAFQQDGHAEPAVAAALDAVTKWLLRAGAEDYALDVSNRRAQLETLRHLVRSGGAPPRNSAAPPPASVPPAETPAPGRASAPSEPPAIETAPPSPDVLNDLTEIRPESQGGASMTAHHEGRGAVTSPRPGRPMFEEEFFQPLIAGRAPVRIRCRDGYEIPTALLREVGTYTLLVDADGGPELLYKHAIISIRPLEARG